LIGIPAKRATEIGAPSLEHPFARVFPALRHFAAGDLKVTQCGVFPTASMGIVILVLNHLCGGVAVTAKELFARFFRKWQHATLDRKEFRSGA
jgi:hypothetical protein